MKAPLIALEGLDACGKSTQTELLVSALKEKGVSVGWKRFPGYKITPAGQRLEAYLRGEFGKMEDFDSRMIAGLYAADRLYQVADIERMRLEHDVIIFDRGVFSNIMYSAGRMKRKQDQDEMIRYVEKMEYDFYGFPRESLVLFLDASNEARAKIHAAKNRLPDIHEANTHYLDTVRSVASRLCDDRFYWTRVSVDRMGELRRREDISSEILNLVLEKLQMK